MARRGGPRVAVIGAGLGGVAAAVKLKKAGFRDFTVFEKADGPGGVWWSNTYPGCEVDVESHAYSYSFMPHDWSRTHAGQKELQQYIEQVIDHFAVRDHFRFGREVVAATWDDGGCTWTLRLGDGEEAEFDAVISALGLLSHPRLPAWPGLDEFEGPAFHTSRYEHEHDLTGKRVALVGTGSTACQLAPELAKVAGHLDVYQRQPGWIMPKKVQEFDEDQRARFRTSFIARRRERYNAFKAARENLSAFVAGSERQKTVRGFGLGYLAKVVKDEEIRAALTPDYGWGCKRPVLANGFYKIFGKPNVSLVPHAVSTVTPTGLVDDTGTERPADVLIMATGYQATNFLGTIDVRGPGGVSLAEHWAGEPSAFLGITVPGFPNLFIVYGPNTNGGWSVIAQQERQVSAIVRGLKRLRRPWIDKIDTRRSVAARWDRWLQKRIAANLSILQTGCSNYYTADSGRNVTQWPGTHTRYQVHTLLLPTLGWVGGRAKHTGHLSRGADTPADVAVGSAERS